MLAPMLVIIKQKTKPAEAKNLMTLAPVTFSHENLLRGSIVERIDDVRRLKDSDPGAL